MVPLVDAVAAAGEMNGDCCCRCCSGGGDHLLECGDDSFGARNSANEDSAAAVAGCSKGAGDCAAVDVITNKATIWILVINRTARTTSLSYITH